MKRNSQKVPIRRTIGNVSVLRGCFFALPPSNRSIFLCRLPGIIGNHLQEDFSGISSETRLYLEIISHPGNHPVFSLTKNWEEPFKSSWQHSSPPKPEKMPSRKRRYLRMRMSTERQDRMRRGIGNEKYPNR
jgi:hypothetical protein